MLHNKISLIENGEELLIVLGNQVIGNLKLELADKNSNSDYLAIRLIDLDGRATGHGNMLSYRID